MLYGNEEKTFTYSKGVDLRAEMAFKAEPYGKNGFNADNAIKLWGIDSVNRAVRDTSGNVSSISSTYKLTHGVYLDDSKEMTKEMFADAQIKSVGINWDKVEYVKTPSDIFAPRKMRSFLEDKGFEIDRKGTLGGGVYKKAQTPQKGLKINSGEGLPKDLADITYIYGDTYPNKDAIKKAGFKWDPKREEWYK